METINVNDNGLNFVGKLNNNFDECLASNGGQQWKGKTWYAYGASQTEYGPYTNALRDLSGMTLVNKGMASQTLCRGEHKIRDAIMDLTDGKTNADIITIEVLGNEGDVAFGTVYDGLNTDGTTPNNSYDTILGCIVRSIIYLQQNTHAQIVLLPYMDSRYIKNQPGTATTPNRLLAGGMTLAERRASVERVCNMYGAYFIDPNFALGWGRKTDAYFLDHIHQTPLGGYVIAEYLWSKIKDIPLWRTALPT